MVDRTFTKHEQKEILKAINEWNVALNGQLVLQVVDLDFDMEPDKIEQAFRENGILILSVPSYGSVMRFVDDGNLAGKVDGIGGHTVYLLNDRITKNNAFAVALHEIGHVLGSEHTETGLMHPRYSPSRTYCVDKLAIQNVAAFYGLDVKRLNYCEVK